MASMTRSRCSYCNRENHNGSDLCDRCLDAMREAEYEEHIRRGEDEQPGSKCGPGCGYCGRCS
jgi:hypothetical protein